MYEDIFWEYKELYNKGYGYGWISLYKNLKENELLLQFCLFLGVITVGTILYWFLHKNLFYYCIYIFSFIIVFVYFICSVEKKKKMLGEYFTKLNNERKSKLHDILKTKSNNKLTVEKLEKIKNYFESEEKNRDFIKRIEELLFNRYFILYAAILSFFKDIYLEDIRNAFSFELFKPIFILGSVCCFAMFIAINLIYREFQTHKTVIKLFIDDINYLIFREY